MASEDDEPVVADFAGWVRTLTLNRPFRLNAFTADSYRALGELLIDAERDDAVRVVLLRGAGRAFSSGVDLDHLAESAAGSGRLGECFDGLMEAILSLTKPLVAAVRGPAVGFGATILLHCDFVLLADDARLRFPFAALSTAPEAGSSVLLPSVVGHRRAAELFYTSRWVEPDEAVTMGLATRRCAGETLDSAAFELASRLAGYEPEAVTSAKRLLVAGRAEAVRAAMERERLEARRLREAVGPMRRADA